MCACRRVCVLCALSSGIILCSNFRSPLILRSPAAHSVRTFAFETLGGDYRRVMMRPCGFEWELIRCVTCSYFTLVVMLCCDALFVFLCPLP